MKPLRSPLHLAAVLFLTLAGHGYAQFPLTNNSPVVLPPIITLIGSAAITNAYQTPFTDPGATATAPPLAIAGGEYHNLALRSDGTLAAWGYNEHGETNIPAGLSNVVAIAGGSYHNLVLKSDGTVVAWGYNDMGQTNIPAGLSNVVAIAGGGYHSLALRSNGTVVAWGTNPYGELDIAAGLSNVVAIAAGDRFSLALKSDGTVVASGFDGYGQTNVPAGLSDVVAIAGGGYHSLALKSDGTLAAWGFFDYNVTNVPAGLSNVVAIDAGFYHNLVLKSDGTVAAWGNDANGATAIPEGLSNAVAIAAGGFHNLALKRDGTVVGSGGNGNGQTDIPAGLSIPLPVTVSGSVNVNVPGSYTLTYTATNILGHTVTATRTVVVPSPVPPSIITPPVGQSFMLGSGLMLSVTAEGPGPLFYQWQFNGTNLAGATDAMLTLTNLTALNAGAYRVVITNAVGSIASVPVDLYFYGDLKFMATTVLAGTVGQQFRVDYADVLVPGTTNWQVLTNLTLPSSPFVVVDYSSAGQTKRFYRAVPVP